MSSRVGLLILVLVLAISGVLLVLTGGSSERGEAAALEDQRIDTPTATATLADADQGDTVTVSSEKPSSGARSAVAPAQEEGGIVPPAESTTVDRASVAVLSGYVHDSVGGPVSGAKIVASGSVVELMAADSLGAFAAMDPGSADRYRETQTDSSGFFELVGIPPGQPALQVTAAGFVPQVRVDLLVATREHQMLNSPIVLDASAVVSGIVIDPNGQPVVGAKVTTKKKSAGIMGMAMAAMSEKGVKTASDGTFQLDTLEPEELEVVVTHASFAIATADVDAREGVAIEGLEVRLEKGLSIHGHVTGMSEGIAETLQVVALPEDFNPMQGLSHRASEVANDGSFELWGLGAGSTWNVYARENDGEELTMSWMWSDDGLVTDRVELVAGDAGAELVYRTPVAVSFRVVDASTERPLTRMSIHGGGSFFGMTPDAEDYPDGRVRLEGQRADSGEEQLFIHIDAEGYKESTAHAELNGDLEIDLGTLKLEPAVMARFRALDAATGAPLEGASISVAKKQDVPADLTQALGVDGIDSVNYGQTVDGTSDADGLALVETPLEGQFRITGKAEGYAPLTLSEVALAGSDVTPLTVEFHVGSVVRVLATDSNGVPLPARKIDHREPGAAKANFWEGGQSGMVTDADGVALFEHQAAGLHRFRIEKFESASEEPNMMSFMMAAMDEEDEDDDSWKSIDLGLGGVEQLVLVELPTGRLTGLITEAGKPLKRATMTLRKADAEEPTADEELDPAEEAMRMMGQQMAGQGGPSVKSERDGSFAFEGVDVGIYVLEIDHRKRAMRAEYEITIVAGDQVQDFDLELAVLAGNVVDENGAGIKGALVSVIPVVDKAAVDQDDSQANAMLASGLMSELLGVEGQVRTFKTKRDGSFELRGVTPGLKLVVKVDGSEAGYQDHSSEPLELERNAARDDVRIVLQRGGSLDVTVVDADGTAAEFVLVRLVRVDGAMDPMNELAMGGVKQLTGLTPGTYRVIADDEPDEDALFGAGDASTIGKVEATVEIVGGETKVLELRLP